VPKLTPIKLGEAELLRKGAFLVSLGNPFHAARDGNASASWGILSNTARRIIPPREDALEARQLFRHQPTLLQLDTKLSLGMSGGAVVNLKGELVGITTTGGNVEGFDAMAGYAVPMDALGRRVVGALIEGREAEYGFLGIRLDERAPNLVGGVEPGTPAAEGDLVVGDLVRSVNGRPVSEETGLSLALSTAPVGEPVRLEVDRDGKVLVKTVFLSKYPINGEVIATNRPSSWRGLRVDFTSVLARSTFNDAVLQAMAKGCVSVVEVQAGSPAETAGLRRGQVITRVGEKAVRTPTEFAEVVAALKGPVELQTDRGAVTIK
jgi:S1-C subfamily serine protease